MIYYVLLAATATVVTGDRFIEYDKVWTDNQCSRVETPWTETLSECMSKCKETNGCNAIDYKHDRFNVCVHRNCTRPIPRPTLKLLLYKGYSLIKDRFVKHNNIWTDNECERIGNPWAENLSDCMSKCKINTECTALDYKHDLYNVCVLRACNGSVPQPTWVSRPYKGYSLIKESPTVKAPTTPAPTSKPPATWAAITRSPIKTKHTSGTTYSESPTVKVPTTPAPTTKPPATWMAIKRSPTKTKPSSESSSSILIGSITFIIFMVLLFTCIVLYLKKEKNKDQQEQSLVDGTSEHRWFWIRGSALVQRFTTL